MKTYCVEDILTDKTTIMYEDKGFSGNTRVEHISGDALDLQKVINILNELASKKECSCGTQ